MKNQNLSKILTIAIFTGIVPLSSYANICKIIEAKFERTEYKKISDFDDDFKERYEKYKKRCDLDKYAKAEKEYQKKVKEQKADAKEREDLKKDRETFKLTKEEIRDYYDNSPIIAYRGVLRYSTYNGKKNIYLQKASDANAVCKNLLDDKNAMAKSATITFAEKEHFTDTNTVEMSDVLEQNYDGDSSLGFTIENKGFFSSSEDVVAGTVVKKFETDRKKRLEFLADLQIRQASGRPSTFIGDIRALEFTDIECVVNPVNKKDDLEDIKTKLTVKTKVNELIVDGEKEEQKIAINFDDQELRNFTKQKGVKDDSNDRTVNDTNRGGASSSDYTTDDIIDDIMNGGSRSFGQ